MAGPDVLDPVADEQEGAGLGRVPHEVSEQLDRRRGGPLHVLERQDDRLLWARRSTRSTTASNSSKRADGPASSKRPLRPAGKSGPSGPVPVSTAAMSSSSPTTSENAIANGWYGTASSLSHAPGEHQRTVGVRPVGDLGEEPGLADPGCARDQHRCRSARLHRVPASEHRGELVAPADQREAAIQRERRRDRTGQRVVDRVDHPEDRHRLVEALERVRADGVEFGVDAPLAEPLDQVGRQDLAGSGHGLQPRALDDRDTVDVVVFLDHLAHAEPDPDLKRGDRVRVCARTARPRAGCRWRPRPQPTR